MVLPSLFIDACGKLKIIQLISAVCVEMFIVSGHTSQCFVQIHIYAVGQMVKIIMRKFPSFIVLKRPYFGVKITRIGIT